MLNSECKVKPGLPDVYNYYENKYLDDIINILNDNNITINKQLVNYNTQVIGLLITVQNKEIFIPVKPSKIIKDYDYDFFEETYTGISLQETLLFYKLLNRKTQEKLFLSIRSFILENQMVVGLITETNQFVPVIPIPYDKLKMNPDNLYDVIDTGNEYILDEVLINSEEEDIERKRMVKIVELESNFYMAFRNTLKIKLKQKENNQIKDELNYLLNLNEPYVAKLKSIVSKLKALLEENVVFINFKDNSIFELNKIYNCIGLDGDQCSSSNNNCLLDDASCKLLIPKRNLISNEDNTKIYYYRLADELIRYPKIKDYIMLSKNF